MNKLLVIDGNSLINRAYHGVPPLYTKDGVPTNAINGFLRMVLHLLESESPTHFAVAFDLGGKVFRHELFLDYKAHRKPMDEELREQIPLIKEVLGYMNVPILGLSGYEGDDVIGTLTKLAEENNYESVIVSGDRDTFQLISDKTTVIFPKKGLKNVERLTPEILEEVYSLSPSEIIDLKALMGDSSDNIPGVKGIGETYAKRFIKTYGTLENLYQNLGDFSGKKLGEKLEAGRDMAVLSKTLATIKRDIPLEVELSELALKDINKEAVEAFFKRYELNQLRKSVFGLTLEVAPVVQYEKHLIEGFEQIKTLCLDEESPVLSLCLGRGQEEGNLYFAFDEKIVYSFSCKNQEDRQSVFEVLLQRQNDENKVLYVEDRKAFFYFFNATNSLVLQPDFDFALMDYLLHADSKEHRLALSAEVYFGEKADEVDGYFEAYALFKVMPKLIEDLREKNLMKLYLDIEAALASVLVKMEKTGIAVDREYLLELQREFSDRLSALEENIYQAAGETFNLNSPKQLGEILFEKLGFPVIKKTKTGYSTDVEVLEALFDQGEIIDFILAYRQLAKLKNTYVDGLLNLITEENRIHTTFNQTITATGRLSSTEPNLQNIPIRTQEGKRIRKAFVPLEAEHVLVSADYSQIELRILAHMSEDENLLESFRNSEDIHKRTASEVFHVQLDEVTSEMRRVAKAVNFGIIYGQTDFGLAKELGITRVEAKKYIASYFDHYHQVGEFIQEEINKARAIGYTKTLFERIRLIKDINSKNFNVRSFAERTAVNSPIQGTAADIIKVAMLKCQEVIEKEGLQAKMLLQVHDELIFDVPPKELAFLITKIKHVMSSVIELKVPLEVDIKVGFNWDEMEVIN